MSDPVTLPPRIPWDFSHWACSAEPESSTQRAGRKFFEADKVKPCGRPITILAESDEPSVKET